jgi:hypothetical protein
VIALGDAANSAAQRPQPYVGAMPNADFYGDLAVRPTSLQAFALRFGHEDAAGIGEHMTAHGLAEWTLDPNSHVRRPVPEGTRPPLPWAPRLPAFQEGPRPVLALLELLKDDPVRDVQRSVANNSTTTK